MQTVIVTRTNIDVFTYAVSFDDAAKNVEMLAEVRVSNGPIKEVEYKERVSLLSVRHDGNTETVHPQFKHDCDKCVFLGRFYSGINEYEKEMVSFDLYYCGGSLETVIARFGSDGPDYISGLNFANIAKEHRVFPLVEARNRAIRLGLLDL